MSIGNRWILVGLIGLAGGAQAAAGDSPRMPAAVVDDATQALWDQETSLPEGWVLLSRCIDKDAAVTDPVVLDSSGHRELEQLARDGAAQSKYTAATIDGTPIDSCDQQFVQFQRPDADHGARPEFLAAWKKAELAIEKKQYDEAKAALDAIQNWNTEESIRLAMLRAEIARAQHDDAAQLRWLETVMDSPANVAPELAEELMNRAFVLQVAAQQYAAALTTWQQLQGIQGVKLSHAEKKAGEQLESLPAGAQPYATPGKLDATFAGGSQTASWSAKLLRREFAFANAEGNPERFELRCENKHYRAAFDTTNQWRVPDSWGACSVVVFGPAEATFKLLELPKSPAAG